MAKQTIIDYQPTSPPAEFDDWPRWMDEELYHIAEALLESPVIMVITGSGNINFDTTINTIILGQGQAVDYAYPEGTWDTAAGEWTCPLSGVYSLAINMTIDPFGTGNKNYSAIIKVYKDGVFFIDAPSGGIDDQPLGIGAPITVRARVAQRWRVEVETLHTQFTGTSPYRYTMTYTRIAGDGG